MCIIHCKRDNHVLQVVQNKAEIRCSSAIRDQKQIFLTSLFISHIQALFYSLSILHLQWQMSGHCRLLSWRPLTGIDGFNISCAFKVFSVRYLGGGCLKSYLPLHKAACKSKAFVDAPGRKL